MYNSLLLESKLPRCLMFVDVICVDEGWVCLLPVGFSLSCVTLTACFFHATSGNTI